MASADFPRDVQNARSPHTSPSQNPTSSTRSGDDALSRVLGRLATQRNRRQSTRETVRALGIGAAICAPLVLLHRLYLLDLNPTIPLAVLVTALLTGLFFGWRQRVGTFEAARDADAALGLEDRLASALSFAQPQAWQEAKNRGRKTVSRTQNRLFPASTSLVPALLEDAASRAASLDPKQVYPQTFDRRTKWCLAALALLLAFTLIPDLDFLRSVEDKKFAATIKQQGKELEQIAKPILRKNDIEASAQTKKLAYHLESIAKQMQRGRMNRGQALLGIGELKRDLERAAQNEKSSGQNDNLQRLQEALKNADMQSDQGKGAKAELQKNDAQAAADQMDKLAERMERGDMTPEEKQKAANDLEKAADALRKNGQQDAARKLEDAAKALREQAKNPQGNQQDQQGQSQQQGAQKQGAQKQGAQQQNQNGQQGQQKSGQQSQQNQQGQDQQGQDQQKQNGQSGQPQNQQSQGQQGQGQQKSGQNGQGQQNQQGQQGQKGQNSQQQNSQQGSQGLSTQNTQQNGQQGQQQGQGGQSPQGQRSNGAVQGGSQALRDMANGLRGQNGQGQSGGSGNSKNLQDMLDKIKEAERNSGGQNSGQNPGQGQMPGNGSSPGQQGQSVTPSKDLMPSDPKGLSGGGPGLGPRNNSKGVQKGGGVSNLKSKRTGDKRRWADVWSDRLPKTRKGLDRITGKMGANGEMEQLQTQTEAKGGKASAPYYNVYESYKKDAEDAVAREAVPPAYKQPVKDYFESLKP